VRDNLTERLSQRLRVNRQHITERFKKRAASVVDDSSTSQNIIPNASSLGPLEESFFMVLVTKPELILSARQYISPEIFTDALSANVYSIILDSYDQKGNLDGLLDAVAGDPGLTRLISMLLVRPAIMEDVQAEFVQKIMLLRRKYVKARMADLREELKVCPEEEKGRLLEELMGCGEQLKELDSQG
jgi:DNA primase